MKEGKLILALALSGGQTHICLPFCHWMATVVTRPGPYFSAWVNWLSRP